ncbi:Poly(A) polymerase [Achlya hypogyna]|uniref:Poly(A) polymerase n=1 Tax=Achlya hypogyna TaxID=1202772 RepID=A0A1V9ZUP3_ACHHY|nr:Poly(A) polymerase [Achlya hypogyna]
MNETSAAPMVLEQAYKAIRTTPPEPVDLELSTKLQSYMDEHFPMEVEKNIQRRTIILGELRSIFRAWVKDVCLTRGLPEEIANEAGGIILVSGSYRLGVNEPGADIDTICVAPKFVTREDFFTSLKDILLKHVKVTNLVAIEGAVVPILTFDYEEINIDLQIAILERNSIPDNLNVLDDNIFVGVDTATEKSLNGPRVTELVIKLTPNRASFIAVLRIVRRWAKKRGLYSNKMGYLGGVNYCILVCFINQLYPTAAPSTLLLRFFMILTNWKWPLAIQLCKTHDAKLGLEVWNANVGGNKYQVMPILTPAYPSMNSSYNVSVHSLNVMKEEFKRGLEVVKTIIKDGGSDWSALFEPTPYFVDHQHYLAVEIFTSNPDDSAAWCGYAESRLRKLVDSLAYYNPQLCRLRVHPKKFPLTYVNDDPEDPKHGGTYFVAFDVDKLKLRNSKEIHLNGAVDDFKLTSLYRWPKRVEGMDVKITPVVWKNLPEFVFEDLGGKKVAKEMRQKLLKKKKEELAKLEELAAATLSSPVKAAASQPTPEASQETASTADEEDDTPLSAPEAAPEAPPSEQAEQPSEPGAVEAPASVPSSTTPPPAADAASPPSTVKRCLDESLAAPEAPTVAEPQPTASPPKRKKMKISFTK